MSKSFRRMLVLGIAMATVLVAGVQYWRSLQPPHMNGGAATRVNALEILSWAHDYRRVNGRWPTSEHWLQDLRSLTDRPSNLQIIERASRDAWGRPFKCFSEPTGSSGTLFYCISPGPNGRDDLGKGDDLVSTVSQDGEPTFYFDGFTAEGN